MVRMTGEGEVEGVGELVWRRLVCSLWELGTE
jgi:hypothetical protein